MKQLLLGLFIAFVVLLVAVQVPGTKFGYANEALILSSLPETKQINADLRAYERQLKNRMEAKMQEIQSKGQDYEKNYSTMTDLERADKQAELNSMQESLIKFQQDAETSIQEKQEKLLQPVLKKVQSVIDKIAENGNFTYILKADALLYAQDSEDISFLVLEKLGVNTEELKQKLKEAKQ